MAVALVEADSDELHIKHRVEFEVLVHLEGVRCVLLALEEHRTKCAGLRSSAQRSV